MSTLILIRDLVRFENSSGLSCLGLFIEIIEYFMLLHGFKKECFSTLGWYEFKSMNSIFGYSYETIICEQLGITGRFILPARGEKNVGKC